MFLPVSQTLKEDNWKVNETIKILLHVPIYSLHARVYIQGTSALKTDPLLHKSSKLQSTSFNWARTYETHNYQVFICDAVYCILSNVIVLLPIVL